MRVLAILILSGLLAACTTPPPRVVVETQVVEIPVPVRPTPPAELMAPYRPSRPPQWLMPHEPGATVCLNQDGEDALLGIVYGLFSRDRAWRAWATEPLP